MALFSDITGLKLALGGAINQSLQYSSVEPYLDEAVEAVRPMLGDAVLTRCIGGTANAQLLALVRRAVGHIGIEMYSKVGSVQFGEAGMVRVESEERRGAYKYQEVAWRRQMLTMGWDALERALIWLSLDAGADSTAWTGPARERHASLLVFGAAVWREADGGAMSRFSYEALRGVIEEVEDYLLKGFLPRAFVVSLTARIHAGTASTDDKALAKWMRKGVCHFVRMVATSRMLVVIEGNTLVSRELLGDQSFVKENLPVQSNLKSMMTAGHVWSVRAMEEVRRMLTIEAFPGAWHTDAAGSSTADDAWGKTLPEAEAKLPSDKALMRF